MLLPGTVPPSPKYARARPERLGMELMVATELYGVKKNMRFVFPSRPTIRELKRQVEKAFQREAVLQRPEEAGLAVVALTHLSVYEPMSDVWVKVERQGQLHDGAQLYASQKERLESVAGAIPPPSPTARPQTPRKHKPAPAKNEDAPRDTDAPAKPPPGVTASKRLAYIDKLRYAFQAVCTEGLKKEPRSSLSPSIHLPSLLDRLLLRSTPSAHEIVVTLTESVGGHLGNPPEAVSLAQFSKWGRAHPHFIDILFESNGWARWAPPRDGQLHGTSVVCPTPAPANLPRRLGEGEAPHAAAVPPADPLGAFSPEAMQVYTATSLDGRRPVVPAVPLDVEPLLLLPGAVAAHVPVAVPEAPQLPPPLPDRRALLPLLPAGVADAALPWQPTPRTEALTAAPHAAPALAGPVVSTLLPPAPPAVDVPAPVLAHVDPAPPAAAPPPVPPVVAEPLPVPAAAPVQLPVEAAAVALAVLPPMPAAMPVPPATPAAIAGVSALHAPDTAAGHIAHDASRRPRDTPMSPAPLRPATASAQIPGAALDVPPVPVPADADAASTVAPVPAAEQDAARAMGEALAAAAPAVRPGRVLSSPPTAPPPAIPYATWTPERPAPTWPAPGHSEGDARTEWLHQQIRQQEADHAAKMAHLYSQLRR